MKTNYTDSQLQAAIDEACDKLAQSTRVYLNALDLANTTESWPVEAPARLDLIKSALAALPEPEPPTVDWKAKAERVEHERNGWSQMHGDMKVRAEKAEAELARIIEAAHEAGWNGVENPKDLAQFIKALAEEVGNRQAALLAACTNADELKGKADRWYNQAKSENVKYLAAVEEIQLLKTACDRMSEQEVLSLSQLRPLAEAGPVPEGCVRHYTYKKDGEWTTRSKYRAMQDTHYIDTRLPEPEPLVTKPILSTSWYLRVGDVVTLKSGGPKMTVRQDMGNELLCAYDSLGEIKTVSIPTNCLQSA